MGLGAAGVRPFRTTKESPLLVVVVVVVVRRRRCRRLSFVRGCSAGGDREASVLLARRSSEDLLFAVLFALHAFVTPVDVVASDINPSWEKGPLRNAREFKKV